MLGRTSSVQCHLFYQPTNVITSWYQSQVQSWSATGDNIEKINSTLIALMRRLDGTNQRFDGQNKELDSISGYLHDTGLQTRTHNLATAKLENSWQQESSTHAENKEHDGLLPRHTSTDDHPPRFFKIEFRTYDAERSINSSMRSAQPSRRRGNASFHLTGAVQLWYQQYEEEHGPPTWCHLNELINIQFRQWSRSNA